MSIKLDGKTHYPKFGNVVILVSGSRSGKDSFCVFSNFSPINRKKIRVKSKSLLSFSDALLRRYSLQLNRIDSKFSVSVVFCFFTINDAFILICFS
ncbi:MAG: hypothetical protein QG673_1605 [Pseudomonadota bacterium]|nr:hypothetical protein [Pseudomonadota bacterium]